MLLTRDSPIKVERLKFLFKVESVGPSVGNFVSGESGSRGPMRVHLLQLVGPLLQG